MPGATPPPPPRRRCQSAGRTRHPDEVTKDQVLGMIILVKQPEEETAEGIAKLH